MDVGSVTLVATALRTSVMDGPNGLRSAIVGPIRAGALARAHNGGAATPSESEENGAKDTRRP